MPHHGTPATPQLRRLAEAALRTREQEVAQRREAVKELDRTHTVAE